MDEELGYCSNRGNQLSEESDGIGSVLLKNRSGCLVDTGEPEWPGEPVGRRCSRPEGRWLRLDVTFEGLVLGQWEGMGSF